MASPPTLEMVKVDAAVVLLDDRIDELGTVSLEARQGARFVRPHEQGEADDTHMLYPWELSLLRRLRSAACSSVSSGMTLIFAPSLRPP